MQDLTQGSIPKHLVALAAPIAAGMLFQTLYFLVDLYFVAKLGDAAIAGVSAAGNVQFIVMALTQILGVGTMSLIAQATGRKDRVDANLIFNQSLILAGVCAAITVGGGYAFSDDYMDSFGADAATAAAGIEYLYWFIPGLALQFALVAMGSALRGTGIAKPTMVVQVLSVLLNAVLAPVLIAGWLTGKPMGVAGAGLATSIAVAAAALLMLLYFMRLEKFVGFDPAMFKPRVEAWKRILTIGLPPGGEFALMFVFTAVGYWVIRGFGAEAQAGYGVGSRIMQAIFLPAMAVAFAVAPLAGQNVGAKLHDRVRQSFRAAMLMSSVIMAVLTLLCQVNPEFLVRGFTDEEAVIGVAVEFLRYISWNFVAAGIAFVCSSMFQALGNTVPALLSSASRILTYVIPAIVLSQLAWFELRHLWMLSVVTAALQALISYALLRREFARRLPVQPTMPFPEAAAAPDLKA
ncbi:MAG: MATE family efflux transporter [Rhodospirillaceae bacterium]|nr:MATE family efflux transporter [Rhodospirillaceae bacterium]